MKNNETTATDTSANVLVFDQDFESSMVQLSDDDTTALKGWCAIAYHQGVYRPLALPSIGAGAWEFQEDDSREQELLVFTSARTGLRAMFTTFPFSMVG